MKKYKYPLSAAEHMGAAGRRCPQIINNPIDRRIPVGIKIEGGVYVLCYMTEDLDYGTKNIYKIDWSGFDRGGRVPETRIGIIGEHGPEAIHSIGPSHKDGLIRELVIQNDLRPVDKVYRSEAWTGRRPPISSPDLTLEEAWANFERELEELFARSWVLRYGRTFFAVENYIDDDGEFRARTKFIFAIKRSRRKEIKREINNRNFWTRINYRFSVAGFSLRKAADNLSRDLVNLTHKLRKDQKDG